MTALTLLGDSYRRALAADPKTALDKVLAEAQRNPLVKSASIVEGQSVTCEFQDGVILSIGATRLPGTGAPPPELPTRAPAPKWLSSSAKAAVIGTLGDHTGMSMYGTELAGTLTRSGFSLVGGRHLTGTFDEFNSLRDLGLLYVDSHGSRYGERVIDGKRTQLYALFTSEAATEQSLARFASLLASKELILKQVAYRPKNLPKDADLPVKTVIALTGDWIAKQNWMAPNGIIYLNTCNSGIPSMLSSMRGTNTGIYFGWDRPVDDAFANKNAKRLFTLMADKDGSRRSWQEAIETLTEEDLMIRSYDRRHDSERFVFAEGTTKVDNLQPRILSVDVNEDTLEATVKGVFGSAKGTVLENGLASRPMAVKSWTEDTIVVQLKSTTFGLMAKTGSRDTGLHHLKVWTISGPNGGPISVKNRVKLVLANRTLTQFKTLVDEPPGTPEGNKGPYYFHADMSKRFALTFYTDSSTGGFGEVWATSPSGNRRRIMEAWPVQPLVGTGPEPGLINLMWGWFYLDRI